jgi:hypothetical protein
MSFSPKPQTGGETSTAAVGFMLPQLQGYIADVTIIASVGTSVTVTATDAKTGATLSEHVGSEQVVLKYLVENLNQARYNKVTNSALPTSWTFEYFVTFHRVTGDTRNDGN